MNEQWALRLESNGSNRLPNLVMLGATLITTIIIALSWIGNVTIVSNWGLMAQGVAVLLMWAWACRFWRRQRDGDEKNVNVLPPTLVIAPIIIDAINSVNQQTDTLKDDVQRLETIIKSSIAEIMDCFMGMEAQTREQQHLISNQLHTNATTNGKDSHAEFTASQLLAHISLRTLRIGQFRPKWEQVLPTRKTAMPVGRGGSVDVF
ncbi:MAG: hypothetical protein HY272_11305 [Gammaproteobacteria bacterium]|nr:hypothetical protein [Gammaproteobacteria bacterium]